MKTKKQIETEVKRLLKIANDALDKNDWRAYGPASAELSILAWVLHE